jgi:hypothetical protein
VPAAAQIPIEVLDELVRLVARIEGLADEVRSSQGQYANACDRNWRALLAAAHYVARARDDGKPVRSSPALLAAKAKQYACNPTAIPARHDPEKIRAHQLLMERSIEAYEAKTRAWLKTASTPMQNAESAPRPTPPNGAAPLGRLNGPGEAIGGRLTDPSIRRSRIRERR